MYDMIIIGAGPAGMSAAVYGRRAGKSVLMIDGKGFGGQILNTPEVDNYPGFKQIPGFEFATNLYEQAAGLGAELIYEKATGIQDKGSSKIVTTDAGEYETKSIILATGARSRPLGLENEGKFTGFGVSYCATCDGAFYKGRDVAVIGGGNTALEDAEVLTGIANRVYLIHRRDSFRADQANVNRVSRKENLEMLLDTVPEELLGDSAITGLKVRNLKTDEEREISVQGVFVAVGQMPDNQDFENVAELDERGYVIAGEDCETGTEGIFVAGDCRTKKVRQLATATADGAVAALAAVEYINRSEY